MTGSRRLTPGHSKTSERRRTISREAGKAECDKPEGQTAKKRKIKRFILSGEVDDACDDTDELLHILGVLLDKDGSAELLPGGVLFEDQDGRYHTISVEAVIRKVLPGRLDDLLAGLPLFDPWTHTEALTPSGKGAVIKRVLRDGELLNARGIGTADELLMMANARVCRDNMQHCFGNILFENGDGDHFAVIIEAVMSKADPEWVSEVIAEDAEVDES